MGNDKKTTQTSFAISLLIGLIVATVFTSLNDRSEVESQMGSSAAGFAIPELGTGVSLGPQDYLGEVVLLDFWATYCEPCVRTMPLLMGLYDEFQDSGLEILSVNVDHAYDGVFDRVADFKRQFRMTCPVLMDVTGEASEAFHVRNLPTVILIDRDGMIQWVHEGEVDREELRGRLVALLQSAQ